MSRRLAAAVEIIEDPESSRAYKEFRRSDIRGTAQIDAGSRTYQAACTMGETFGGPGMAMPEAMVEEKFLEATSLSLSPSRARALLDALRRIEDVSDITELARHF